MSRRFVLSIFILAAVCLFLITSSGDILAQWPQTQVQQPYPQQPQYPPPQPQYSPGQPQYPPQQPQYPSQLSGQTFSDALGRFRVNLPQGAIPTGATYNFGISSAMCQVSIMAVAQDQMFQMYMQNFPNMLKQMGAKIDTEQPMNVGGRNSHFIAATMKDQMSGMSTHSMNVFISGPNVWVQVMGPEQNVQQLQQTLQSILGGLQF